jgi:hypothetical protein
MNQALMRIVAFVFDYVVKQKFLTGKRSYVGGASAILGGVVLILDMVVNGTFSEEKAGAAWAAISLGYAVIGHAGKQDKALVTAKATVAAVVKNTAAVDQTTDAVVGTKET